MKVGHFGNFFSKRVKLEIFLAIGSGKKKSLIDKICATLSYGEFRLLNLSALYLLLIYDKDIHKGRLM